MNLENLYRVPNTGNYLKEKRLELIGHVWKAKGRLIRNVLVRNSGGKAAKRKASSTMAGYRDQRCVVVNNTKTIEMAKNRDSLKDLVETYKKS